MLDLLKRLLPGRKNDRRKLRVAPRHGKLGMYLGVFAPTILTIPGGIMCLHFGRVLGRVGWLQTLAAAATGDLHETLRRASVAGGGRKLPRGR